MMAALKGVIYIIPDQIGVARRWFQGDHYDICLSKRQAALALGAMECDKRTLIETVKRFRAREGWR